MLNQPAEVFDQFITSLETDNLDAFDSIFTVDATVFTSVLGKTEGLGNIKASFKWQGLPAEKHLRIFNNTMRESDDVCMQSVYILPLFIHECNGFDNIMQCGFLTCIQYVKQNEIWKIKQLNATMSFESGNSLIVSQWWKMIDYSKMFGNNLHIIDAKKNSPWAGIENPHLNDQTAIKQCFYHYCWDLDVLDFLDLENVAVEGVDVSAAGAKDRTQWLEDLENKRLRIANFNGKSYPREACWNHIVSFKSILVDGDKAIATIYRNEPNRIGTRILHKYNLNYIYYSEGWNIEFIKDIDQQWKFKKISYLKGIFTDQEELTKRYF